MRCGVEPATRPPEVALELSWIVHPVDHALVNAQGWPLAPLELRVGSQLLPLEPQMGALNAASQSACHAAEPGGYAYPMLADEVAKITFEEGGAGGYLVKRVDGKLVLYTWSQDDGACEDPKTQGLAACPIALEHARALDVPGTAKVTQRVLVVDATGKQAPLDCSKPYARDL